MQPMGKCRKPWTSNPAPLKPFLLAGPPVIAAGRCTSGSGRDYSTVYPKKLEKLETELRTISAGMSYTLLLRMEAIGFPASTVDHESNLFEILQ